MVGFAPTIGLSRYLRETLIDAGFDLEMGAGMQPPMVLATHPEHHERLRIIAVVTLDRSRAAVLNLTAWCGCHLAFFDRHSKRCASMNRFRMPLAPVRNGRSVFFASDWIGGPLALQPNLLGRLWLHLRLVGLHAASAVMSVPITGQPVLGEVGHGFRALARSARLLGVGRGTCSRFSKPPFAIKAISLGTCPDAAKASLKSTTGAVRRREEARQWAHLPTLSALAHMRRRTANRRRAFDLFENCDRFHRWSLHTEGQP